MNNHLVVNIIEKQNKTVVVIEGNLNATNIHTITSISKINTTKNIEWDLSGLENIDTAGVMFCLEQTNIFESNSKQVSFFGLNEKTKILFELCKKHYITPENNKKTFNINDSLEKLGILTITKIKESTKFLSFFGEMIWAIWQTIKRPSKLRVKATVFHMKQNGVNALPIIALTAFLIGIVISYQGAVLLQEFGAGIFIVDMIGIAATRELAPLITAIVIAGRSASAFTAEIGVMKITDEVDAMKTMGFSVWDFLILPRTLALIIAVPLLVFFADIFSIYGGMIIAKFQLGISYQEFLARFQENIEIKHILIGLIKAPFFGMLIAAIGCYRGFAIEGNTQNVGKYTTISVVNAIFWVIAFDAIASVFLTELGW